MRIKLIFSVLLALTLIIPTCFAAEEPKEKTREERLAEAQAKITPEAINARIEEIRMGNIIVNTRPNSTVKIQQVRHEFLFGTAIPSGLEATGWRPMSEEDREMYLQVLEENFNYAVHENALKWDSIEYNKDGINYSVPDKIWEMCNKRNIPMRGHCIFWAKDKFNRPWVKELNSDELRGRVINRAIDLTRHYKGRIEEFDLNNEMIFGDLFRRRLGYGIINEMAYAAKFGNPDAKLYLNDYHIIANFGSNSRAYATQIENFLSSGLPIDGIGVQAHVISAKNATPERAQMALDELAKFNLPIKMTECLFGGETEEEIAEQMEIYFPIFFAHPNVEAIIMWNFWAKDHWKPETAMWEEDWTPTSQAKAYRDLVFDEWWTKTSGKADKNGEFKTRGFYGDYIITSNGESKKVILSKKDGTLIVNF